MPSLKDLRNRIASVTATRKITKAMQMVAAAKLRRAQEAAEAARPYAERMEAVLANIASGFEGRDDAPVLFAGTGKDDVHLLVVATADRGLCGGFNSSIVKLARERARSLIAQGKTVKILCVGKKGYDLLKRDMGSLIVKTIELRNVKPGGLRECRRDRGCRAIDVRRGRVRRLHAVLCTLQLRDQPGADGPAAHPGHLRGGCRLRRGIAVALRVRAGRGRDP